jgi:conjugal transfer pilus assembly protein TraK
MHTKTLILCAMLTSTAGYAQQDTRATIPVAPVIDRPLTVEEVENRQATPPNSITGTYDQQFNGVAPVTNVPTTFMPTEFLNKVAQTWEPTQSFAVSPKDSIMIPVGQGLMNTLSTNLTRVAAKSNDETSAFEIDEGYLYVTVNTLNPISIILYEEGVLDSQISVTLVPIPAPPTLVEIEFDLADELVNKAKTYRDELEIQETINQQSQQQNTNHTPYQQMVVDMLLPVARGDIPRGFGLTPTIPEESRYPCSMTIHHQAEQRLIGGKFIIDVVHVVNDSQQTYNVREEMCLSKFVTAVALFEKAYLRPGEQSEIYILRDKRAEDKMKARKRRPSLIRG